MAWVTTEDGRRVNTDWFDKDRQVSESKKEADSRNEEGKSTSATDIQESDSVKKVQSMVANKEFSKLGAYLSEHREEFGLRKSEDTYMAAYQIINGERSLKNSKSEKLAGSVKEKETKEDISKNNSKYAPSADDVIDPNEYFKNTTVKVNQSLSQWKSDADKAGIPDVVNNYMEDSSINERLRSGGMDESDMRMVHQLDNFVNSSKIKKGSIIYSGLTSEEAVQLFDKPEGEVVHSKSFTSSSPDPVYARGYSMNTDVILQIQATRDTPIGKTYYEDSTGTEGILGRNTDFKIIGRATETINGETVKVIKVEI